MKSILGILTIAAIVAMFSLSPFVASFAAGSSSITVSGRYFAVSTVTSEKACGSNECVTGAVAETLTGGLSGTAACYGSNVVLPSGVSYFQYTCTFVGSVKGVGSGIATVTETGKDVPTSSGTIITSGHDTFSAGTGGLTGVTGQGTFHGVSTSSEYGPGTDTTHFTW
ncbi:MAG TPA: hypothetical protein VED17_00965 [Nitrososphaerales archaeon]|nr:hypothetical protein [Nitrososphaerales archaeon]